MGLAEDREGVELHHGEGVAGGPSGEPGGAKEGRVVRSGEDQLARGQPGDRARPWRDGVAGRPVVV
eukprot:4773820-Prymnesium_polylepis.1